MYPEDRVDVRLKLPKGLHERLRETSRLRVIAANQLIVNAVAEYLDHLDSLGVPAPRSGG